MFSKIGTKLRQKNIKNWRTNLIFLKENRNQKNNLKDFI